MLDPPQRILTLAAAPVGRISVESGDAALAVSAGCQVLTLLTHTLVDTLAVTVTLTGCRRENKAHTGKKRKKGYNKQPWARTGMSLLVNLQVQKVICSLGSACES